MYLREALDLMQDQNYNLERKLGESRKSIKQQRRVIEEGLARQKSQMSSLEIQGLQLGEKVKNQAEFLEQSKRMLDTSQISTIASFIIDNTGSVNDSKNTYKKKNKRKIKQVKLVKTCDKEVQAS